MLSRPIFLLVFPCLEVISPISLRLHSLYYRFEKKFTVLSTKRGFATTFRMWHHTQNISLTINYPRYIPKRSIRITVFSYNAILVTVSEYYCEIFLGITSPNNKMIPAIIQTIRNGFEIEFDK